MVIKSDRKDMNDLIKEIETYLKEVKSDLLISRFVNKDPYIKNITDDKAINITVESGSGKSTYTKKYLDNDKYIVIDTDEIIKDTSSNNKYCIEFREYLKISTDKDITIMKKWNPEMVNSILRNENYSYIFICTNF